MRFHARFGASSPFGSKLSRFRKAESRKRQGFRIAVESLEGRAVPAVITWDGGAGTSKFNDAANWNVDRIPGPDDDVIIPDLPAGKAVVINGITKLRSIDAEAPIVLDSGKSTYVMPGQTSEGELLVTSGASKLSDGVFAVRGLFLFATGNGTSLTIDGPVGVLYSSTDLTPIPYKKINVPLEVRAMDSARITLNDPQMPSFVNMEFTARGAGSLILIRNMNRIDLYEKLRLCTGDGGTISLPDLQEVRLDYFARSFEIATRYYESPDWFNNSKVETRFDGGSILMPNLTVIDDTQTDRIRKTFISIGGSGDVMDLPKLKSVRNATIQIGTFGIEGLGDWNAPQLESISQSSISYLSPGRSLRLAGLKNLDETSIYVSAGYLTVEMVMPIDLANTRWNTSYTSNGPLSAITFTTPEIRGPLGQGNFFRIEALRGGLVTLNAESLIDTNESKTDGGIYLQADTQGVLRLNVRKSRGATLDLPENGIVAFDMAKDLRFKQIRGWSGGSGRLYASSLETLTVDTFNWDYLRIDGSILQWNLFDANRIFAPRLEAIYGTSLKLEGWKAPAWPAYRTVTWDGGAGTNSWFDAANWSDDKMPGLNSTVIIPAQSGLSEILVDTNVSVRSIESREPLRFESVAPKTPITVQVTSGASALHAGLTLKSATIATRDSGTTLDVYGTTTVESLIAPENMNSYTAKSLVGFTAENGSWLFVHDTTILTSARVELTIKSAGGGSRVVFPSLKNLEFDYTRYFYAESIVRLFATDRAEIDLPQLRTIEAWYAIQEIYDSWISSPNLTSLRRTSVTVVDTTDDGIRHAEWIVPNLTSLTGSLLKIVGQDQTASFDRLKTIDGTKVYVRNSKVYFPAIDRIDLNAHFASSDSMLENYSPNFRPNLKDTGFEAEGEGAILEIRANEISGPVAHARTFEILASGGMIHLHIPVVKPVPKPVGNEGRFIFAATAGGTLRSYATSIEGVAIHAIENAAVAIDQVRSATLSHIMNTKWLKPGRFYAASLESLRVTEMLSDYVTDLNMIVAPQLKTIEGNFEAIANPFPLIESIKGFISLKHEPGTPATQFTVFDTPKIRNFDNLKVTMEPAVRWPQYPSGGARVVAISFALQGEQVPGESVDEGSGKFVPVSAPAKGTDQAKTVVASTSTGKAATTKAKTKTPDKVKPATKPAPAKPVAKPKIAPKPVAVKPAPAKKPAAKAVAKP